MKYLEACLWNDKTVPSGWVLRSHKAAQASHPLSAMQADSPFRSEFCLGGKELQEGCTSAMHVVVFLGVASEKPCLGN